MLQRQATTAEDVGEVPPIVYDVVRSPGRPLDDGVRTFMEGRFGADFSGVRIHTDANAAESAVAVNANAYTVGRHLAFGQGRYEPGTEIGRSLLAHELTHTLQQRAGGPPPALSPRSYVEADANLSSGAAGRVSTGIGMARQAMSCNVTQLTDAQLQTERVLLQSRLDRPMSYPGRGADELYFADVMNEVGRRGRYDLCQGSHCSLGYSRVGMPIKAYQFAGRSQERALVLGGVHGSELSGIEVAELLVRRLQNASTRPYYTTIIVPVLFPDNRILAESRPGEIGSGANIGRDTGVVGTNRQFPALGQAFDRRTPGRGAPSDSTSPGAADLTIEYENTLLLNLIERFAPSRIASVHAHRTPTMAGVYADPRTDEHGTALGFQSDSDLAIAMARHADAGGANVPGNQLGTRNPNARYPLDPPIAQAGRPQRRDTAAGVSLGGWGTTAVAGGRPAMTVITVEVQTSHPSLIPGQPEAQRSQTRLRELQAHAASIEEVFLGPP